MAFATTSSNVHSVNDQASDVPCTVSGEEQPIFLVAEPTGGVAPVAGPLVAESSGCVVPVTGPLVAESSGGVVPVADENEFEIQREEVEEITPPLPKKKKTSSKNEPSSAVKDVIDYLQNKGKSKPDEIDSLFLAHAMTVKKFSLMRQAITKMKLAQLIGEQEVMHLEEISACSSTPSTSSTSLQHSLPNSDVFLEFGETTSSFVPTYEQL